jgi:hypothetical protein
LQHGEIEIEIEIETETETGRPRGHSRVEGFRKPRTGHAKGQGLLALCSATL